MAEQVLDGSVEELEKEITCAICHGHYSEPKVLPCCHYYCKECILKLVQRTGVDKPFSCPECRMDTTLPQGDINKLQTAFFVNRMKELHSKLERAHGKVEAKCEMCSRYKAEAFCRQCTMFICSECVKPHQFMKVFANHKIASLDELKRGVAKEVVMEGSHFQICKEHEEPMKIYCFDCNHLICRDCTIYDHRNHTHKFVKKAAPEVRNELIEHLNPLKEATKYLSESEEELKGIQCEVKAHGHSVAMEIKSSFEELHKILKQREQKLLEESTQKISEKLEKLSQQEKNLSTSRAAAESVIEYTEQCMGNSTDDDLMCMHAELKSRIDKEMKEHCKEGSLEPVDEADIGVEVCCVRELEQLFQTKTRVLQLPIDPKKCTLTLEGDEKAALVNKESSLILKVKLTNGKPTKQTCVVECHLKSLVSEEPITKCQVNQLKYGEYRIQYTPTVRGRHELTVTVNGEEIADNPFPLCVSIHPTQLGKPVRTLSSLDKPTNVIINSEGNFLITERYGDVVMLDKEGRRLRSIKRSDYEFKRPSSLALDKEDNIYFTDFETNIIYKSDKKMDTVISKNIGRSGASGHYRVAVVGDEALVTERANKSTIKVYNTELEYVREISHDKCHGEFRGIASDEQNNVYVCDYRKSSIRVFNNDGNFLCSFGFNEGKLKSPVNMCIAGQHLYVADWDNHNISVYTIKGEYVTSFGQDNLFSPFGIFVDKDNFLYVCDYNNGKIQVF